MIRLAVLRHGPTEWNAEGRMQGRADLPLSLNGQKQFASRRIPSGFASRRWFVSPLQRARDTAAALGIKAVTESRLIEMDWAAYEGHTLAELKARDGDSFTQNENRGLDFQPPGGESPRQVQARLQPWLLELAQSGTDAAAVSHKGVIRALMAMAYDWPMTGKPPVKLDWSCLHEFRISDRGVPEPLAMNIPLE